MRRYWLLGPGLTGASCGVALLALAVWLLRALALAVPGAPWVSARVLVADLAVAALVAVLALVLATGGAALVRRPLPAPFLGVFLGAAVLLGTMGPGISRLGWAGVALVTLMTGAALGSFVGRARSTPGGLLQGRLRTALTGGVVLVALATGAWLAYPGGPGPQETPERHGTASVDPSLGGSWSVREFSYGSGQSERDRYGAEVQVITDTVDASAALPEWRAGDSRSSVWGFDASALPLNATVWAPVGTGEFPLVLLLHGNAQHAHSELGLGYLAAHLASRGYVVASIDQSFLNTGLLDRAGGLAQGDQVRAWLVRQHLAQWARWGSSAPGPVPAVTLEDVALVGHSRGGEAVAVAAAADPPVELGLPPLDLADVTISTVVALAPSDGLIVQDPLGLEGVDYLTLAGTHDADVSTFAGTRQYSRVSPGADGLKAAVLIHRANHTQFNSRWGRHDAGAGLATRLLNTGVLITPEQQRATTASLVAAFLDASVAGDETARELFTQPLPDAPWLPPTQVRMASAVADLGDTVPIEELAGASSEVVALPSRVGATQREVVLVQGADPAEVPLPPRVLANGSSLALDIADTAPAGERTAPVTVQLTAVDADGNQASCDPVPVSPTLDGRLGKAGVPTALPDSEPFLETVRLPLDCLIEAGADRRSLDTAALVVSGAGTAGIYLDNVGAL